jgi:thiamine-monophosphate kinase
MQGADILLASMTLKRGEPIRSISGEIALIEAIRQKSRVGSRWVSLGIGDDCAVLRPRSGFEICVTTDFTLENRHFRRAWHPPESVGHRCLARGLSDLAAMGAEPVAVFLSLAIPSRLPGAWVERFLNGFLALARRYNVPLAGGDTAQSPAMTRRGDGLIVADVIAIGQTPRGRALLRSGARPGDFLYVTGALGGAAAEFATLSMSPGKFRRLTNAELAHPHLYPEPRMVVGRRLRALAHAAIDVSDGLSTDLTHLCEESGVAAVIEEAALPIHSLAAQRADAIDLALNGGEDYELLFAARPGARVPRRIAGVPIHRIGRLVRQPGRAQAHIKMQTAEGRELLVPAGGWEHFR